MSKSFGKKYMEDVGDWRQSESVAGECQRLQNLSLNSWLTKNIE